MDGSYKGGREDGRGNHAGRERDGRVGAVGDEERSDVGVTTVDSPEEGSEAAVVEVVDDWGSSVGEEKGDDVGVVVVGCAVERSPSVAVGLGDVCALVDELAEEGEVACFGSDVEGGRVCGGRAGGGGG